MSRLTTAARGAFVIAVTPFAEDGALDLASIDSMVDFYEASGVDGITVLGQLGEAHKLTLAEAVMLVERVLARLDGRLPVVVGVSAPGLAQMQELTDAAMSRGAAGVMVAPPWTLRTDDQILAYYRQVGEALGSVPFVLQDYPLTTGVTMAPAVINRIVQQVPTCVMLKHEDWPGLAKISALRAASTNGETRRVSILSGNGALFLLEELHRGVDGAMTGFCFPEMMVSVIAAHAAGDSRRAQDLFFAYLPLARYEQQQGIGLAVRKHVLAERGAIRSGSLRQPGPVLSAADRADITRLLDHQSQRLADLGVC